jgi:murein L,D-transpeptidase YcbB/YkuD
MLKTPPLTGADVQAWLGQMKHRGWKLDSADAYDARSRDVCRQFQKQKGLPVTGSVDAQTWAAAWADPVTPD